MVTPVGLAVPSHGVNGGCEVAVAALLVGPRHRSPHPILGGVCLFSGLFHGYLAAVVPGVPTDRVEDVRVGSVAAIEQWQTLDHIGRNRSAE